MICTGDKTAYKEMYFKGGAVGVIVFDAYVPGELKHHQSTFKGFLKDQTIKKMRDKVHFIGKNKVMSLKLNK